MIRPSFIMGVMGNIISILVFLSPAKTFWQVIKKKSTEDYSPLPYICTLLSTAQWTYYGLMKPGGLLITTVNGTGAFLEAIYVTLFIIYAPKKTKLRTLAQVLLVDVVFFTAVFLVTFLAFHVSTRIRIIGVLCVCLTLGMYGSPLSVMRIVIQTNSVQYMPFLLSFFLFINAGIWTTWAVLEKDIFVGIPNGIGFVLGAAQLILYVVYKNKEEALEPSKGPGVNSRQDLEMGSNTPHNKTYSNTNTDSGTGNNKTSVTS